MVKEMIENMCLCIIVVFLLVISGGHANEAKKWILDPQFSAYLTIMAGNYKALTNSEITDKVDMIRVYHTYDRDGKNYDIEGLLAQKLIFESSDKPVVRDILLAARVEEIHVENCFQNRSNETYYIVAFNNEKRHAGYFLFKLCKEKGIQIGIVRPFQKGDSSTIYYNRSLIEVFKRKKILE